MNIDMNSIISTSLELAESNVLCRVTRDRRFVTCVKFEEGPGTMAAACLPINGRAPEQALHHAFTLCSMPGATPSSVLADWS